MKIGFTGTRNGMSPQQRAAFQSLIECYAPEEFHHGDCVGADADAHVLMALIRPVTRLVIHPPIKNELRANCRAHEMREPKTHFARNRDIVNETELLIATPMQAEHQTCGGTWYTIDYARKQKKSVIIIAPDGSSGFS